MAVKKPTQTFEGFPLVRSGIAPLLLTHIIDGVAEGFDDVEAIQNQSGIGTMIPDGANVGLAHVTTGPHDSLFLKETERIVEEPVNCLPALSLAHPYHTRAFEIVNQGGVFVALRVGDLVDADLFQSPDTVTFAQAGNRAVQQVRESGRWYA